MIKKLPIASNKFILFDTEYMTHVANVFNGRVEAINDYKDEYILAILTEARDQIQNHKLQRVELLRLNLVDVLKLVGDSDVNYYLVGELVQDEDLEEEELTKTRKNRVIYNGSKALRMFLNKNRSVVNMLKLYLSRSK